MGKHGREFRADERRMGGERVIQCEGAETLLPSWGRQDFVLILQQQKGGENDVK